MGYHKSKYDGSIRKKIQPGVTSVNVGDVVGFYADPVETSTIRDTDGKSIRVQKAYQGVVVFVHPERRWCTVQYGHNLRTTLYFQQVIRTNYTAIRVVVMDSALPDSLKAMIRRAANISGAWLAEKPFFYNGTNHANEIGDECLSDVIRNKDGSLQYVQAFSLVSPAISSKYPECMLCDSEDLKAMRLTEDTLVRLLSYAQPPEDLTESPLYIREYVKD